MVLALLSKDFLHRRTVLTGSRVQLQSAAWRWAGHPSLVRSLVLRSRRDQPHSLPCSCRRRRREPRFQPVLARRYRRGLKSSQCDDLGAGALHRGACCRERHNCSKMTFKIKRKHFLQEICIRPVTLLFSEMQTVRLFQA